jgi:hypothetical protein
MPQSLAVREDLIARGFTGFLPIAALRARKAAQVPEEPGVYVVLRESAAAPAFLPTSTGGRFKERDPSVPLPTLQDAWNPASSVVYFGKASQRPLRKRLRQYLAFGAGQPVGHWGGRYVWHLADSEGLVVAWMPTSAALAPEQRRSLVAEFVELYGRRPFANMAG